jgi:hypothetical protein
MREQLNEQEMENVVGGTVIISKDKMVVGFSTTKEKYNLKNCTYRQVRDLVDDLLEANPTLGNAAFDKLAKDTLSAKGWI